MKTDSTNACPKCGATVPPEAPQGLCPKCVLAAAAAAEPAPTATSQIPSLERLAAAFPQLQILELIGRGGMGFVFKARQPHLDRFVALKLLPDSLAHDPQFAERFNREGRVLARLNHPNIVSIFDFGYAPAVPRSAAVPSRSNADLAGRMENSPPSPADTAAAAWKSRAPSEGGFYYLMMEYVDGVNLRQAMQAGRFSPAEALTIVPKICEALQFAHEEGILHRDIKPENILLDAKGRVKIADFGIAKLVGEEHPDVSLTATGAALGTMHYMAPEQIEKPATVDHRADIYSLGVVFYELLTGELPLGRFGPPSAKTPVDSRVDDVVMRTLEKEREKRFQSAGEMGTTVEHLTEVGAGSFKGAPPKASGAEPQRGPVGTMKTQAEPSPGRFLFPYRRAAIAGILLLALIVTGTAVVNLFLPKTYSAKATFTHAGFDNPSEANRLFREIISGPVLSQVITDLDLKSRSSFRSESGPLSDERVMLMLRNRLTVSHMNGTILCDVRAVSESREEAAQLANAVVSAYRAQYKAAEIMERAEASDRPISPRRARNIAIASVLGIPIAAIGGVLFGLWAGWRAKRQKLGGTIAAKPENVVPPIPAWSIKGVLSAALVGLSLLLPLLSLAVLLLKPYRYEEAPAVISFLYKLTTISLLSSIPAFLGTILGWMVLSDVSVSGGRLRGAVFAVFAALAWPVLLLSGVTVWLVVAPIRNFSASAPLASFLLMLVPAGLVTFIIWAIYTTTQKATGQPAPQRRGALKWVFLGLFLALVGFGITSRSNRTSAEADGPFAPLSAAEMLPANMVELVAITRHPSDGAWWNADGAPSEQHVTQRGANATPINGQHAVEFFFRFQNMDLSGTAVTYQFGLCSVSADGAVEENGQPVRDGAIVAATFPDSLRATTVRVGLGIDPWETLATSRKNADSQISFSRKGRPIKVGFVAPVERSPSFTVLTVTHSLEGEAVRAIAVDAAGREHLATETETSRLNEEFSATFPLARRDIREFRFQARPYRWAEFRNVPLQPLERRPSGAVSATATNITPWIRFTFTAVELREVQGVRWLAIEYLDDVHGECDKSFPWETTINGFKGETRTAKSLGGDTNGPVRHQRVEYRMQERFSRPELEDLRDRVAEKLNHKSFRLSLGEELLLFELPTPGSGAFQARIKVVLPLKVGEQIEPGANPLALQFRLVALDADTNALVDVMMEPQGERPARRLRVLRPVLMDGSAVARAGIQLETNGSRTIGIELTAEGARRFESITASNVMRQLAIVSGGRVLSAPMILSAIPGGVLNLSGGRSATEVHQLVAELNRQPEGLEFSPTVERLLLRAPDSPSGSICLDLDTGNYATNRSFRRDERATQDWLQTSGVDLLAIGTADQIPLLDAFDLVSIEAPAGAWDSMSPQNVGWNWALMRDAAKQESQLATMPGRADTFLFRTRENGFGLLQILSVTNPAPDVKIRYKLVKDAPAKQF